jgi:hypothetical protein
MLDRLDCDILTLGIPGVATFPTGACLALTSSAVSHRTTPRSASHAQ